LTQVSARSSSPRRSSTRAAKSRGRHAENFNPSIASSVTAGGLGVPAGSRRHGQPVPPLRERREDLPAPAAHFLAQVNGEPREQRGFVEKMKPCGVGA